MIANVILKVASRCNLNCSYCYLYNHEDRTTLTQPVSIDDRVFEALLDRIGTHADAHGLPIAITIHGGEPTLIGRERIRALAVRARSRLGDRLAGLSLQTNATLILDAWASLFALPALDAWLLEDDPGVVIPLFSDLLARSMGSRRQRTDQFGNPPMTYVVVNTDGSIEPLDALKVCDAGITSTGLNVLTHSLDDVLRGPSLFADALAGRIALSRICTSCRFVALCGGGYLPHRFRRANGFDNPSVWCEDIQLLLARMEALTRDVYAVGSRT